MICGEIRGSNDLFSLLCDPENWNNIPKFPNLFERKSNIPSGIVASYCVTRLTHYNHIPSRVVDLLA